MRRSCNEKRVCIIGHFGNRQNLLNGQTVKTKILADELVRCFGANEVQRIDTSGRFRALLRAPAMVFRAMRSSENVIILPAQNGVRVFAPLLALGRGLFPGCRIHYAVIGGWLPRLLTGRRRLSKALKRFDGIYVETNTMKRALEALGFDNVYVMPNCKKLAVLSKEDLVYPSGEPYRLCTFSRVMKEKGIEDAVRAVERVNAELGHTAFTLDIYGQVDAVQTAWFDRLQKSFPPCVRYGGLVPFDRSVEVLKDYFALLFPTLFPTEGIPGTIIDAYAAGVPVVASRWESFSDIMEEGVTGVGYELGSPCGLYDALLWVYKHQEEWQSMKKNCLREAEKYLPENAMRVIKERLQ